jgi:hypothetical protein
MGGSLMQRIDGGRRRADQRASHAVKMRLVPTRLALCAVVLTAVVCRRVVHERAIGLAHRQPRAGRPSRRTLPS